MIEKIKAREIFDNLAEILAEQDIKIKISGNSMWPFFIDKKTNVRLTKIKSIKKNNIYLFKYQNNYVLHRLIKIKGETLIFQGDGNNVKEIVDKTALVAELVAFENKRLIYTTNKCYRLKVFLYRLLPRRVVIKLFKRVK